MRGRQSILVIEDDETIQNILRHFLAEKGFDITLADNGETGLELVRDERFDLILTDVVMPGKGGMDILREIAGFGRTAPVIVLTAFGTVQTAVEAMKIGAFDYLTKPFSLDELMAALESAFCLETEKRECNAQKGAQGKI